MIGFPDAFVANNDQQRVGDITAVNVAKLELCRVMLVLDHISLRGLPQRGFGEEVSTLPLGTTLRNCVVWLWFCGTDKQG